MSYEALAEYYDVLINDFDGQKLYAEFVKQYTKPAHVLELACGSGVLADLLAQEGYLVDATDMSQAMIATAKAKSYHPSARFSLMDMREFRIEQAVDVVLCFCDSLNYILEPEQIETMFRSVYQSLKQDGVFLFDCHSLDRIAEFREGYEEANYLGDLEYQWTIVSKQDYIIQDLQVWDDSFVPPLFFEEHHEQRVYDPLWLRELLVKIGFRVLVKTDFDEDGIVPGEKQFFICDKSE